jgi:hypothetical protein
MDLALDLALATDILIMVMAVILIMAMVIRMIHIMAMAGIMGAVTLITVVLITILMNFIPHTGEEKDQAVCHQTIMMIWEQEVQDGEPVVVLPAVILLQGEDHPQQAS